MGQDDLRRDATCCARCWRAFHSASRSACRARSRYPKMKPSILEIHAVSRIGITSRRTKASRSNTRLPIGGAAGWSTRRVGLFGAGFGEPGRTSRGKGTLVAARRQRRLSAEHRQLRARGQLAGAAPRCRCPTRDRSRRSAATCSQPSARTRRGVRWRSAGSQPSRRRAQKIRA
jgi:hypothetical protein